MYPNPSNGVFTIEASAAMREVSIADISGQLVYYGYLSGNKGTINAAEFADGAYFLSIRFENDAVQTRRLEVMESIEQNGYSN